MKYALLILKIATAFIWIPLWFLKKFSGALLVLFFAALIDGCASTSNVFDKSPCACHFTPLNNGNYGGQARA